MKTKIPKISTVLEKFKKDNEDKEIVRKIYGLSRSTIRFKTENNLEDMPIILEHNGWVLRYFNMRPSNTSDYILYQKKDLDNTIFSKNIPVIEFNCDNHSLKFNGYDSRTTFVPREAQDIIQDFISNPKYKTTPIEIKETSYLKLYVAVLDEVPDNIVPTLVAHSILGAHLDWWTPAVMKEFSEGTWHEEPYVNWLNNSFRKCVIRVNRKEFEKIKQLNNVYLGHENKTLNGEKSCAIPYPVWSNDIPNVLKFAKLWTPKNNTIIYFDMDGVLADFNLAYHDTNILRSKEERFPDMIYFSKLSKEEKEPIKEELFTYDFFRNMKPIQKGLDMLKYYQSKYEHVVILSSTSNTTKVDEIEQAKRDWLKEHIGDIPAYFSRKAETKYETMSLFPSFQTHVLIDDREKSLDPWIAKGGVGIKFI